jgi:hypothetical protein
MNKQTQKEVDDLVIAKLWRGLESVDASINDVIHTSNFNFSEKSEKAIKALQAIREQQAMIVHCLHHLKNDLAKIKTPQTIN